MLNSEKWTEIGNFIEFGYLHTSKTVNFTKACFSCCLCNFIFEKRKRMRLIMDRPFFKLSKRNLVWFLKNLYIKTTFGSFCRRFVQQKFAKSNQRQLRLPNTRFIPSRGTFWVGLVPKISKNSGICSHSTLKGFCLVHGCFMSVPESFHGVCQDFFENVVIIFSYHRELSLFSQCAFDYYWNYFCRSDN